MHNFFIFWDSLHSLWQERVHLTLSHLYCVAGKVNNLQFGKDVSPKKIEIRRHLLINLTYLLVPNLLYYHNLLVYLFVHLCMSSGGMILWAPTSSYLYRFNGDTVRYWKHNRTRTQNLLMLKFRPNDLHSIKYCF